MFPKIPLFSELAGWNVWCLLSNVCVLNSVLYPQLWANMTCDLWEDWSGRHQWRQCETEHWAFSSSTAASDHQWIMSHRKGAPHPKCHELKGDLLCQVLSALWKQKIRIMTSALHACVIPMSFTDLDVTLTAWRRDGETFPDPAFQCLGSFEWLRGLF